MKINKVEKMVKGILEEIPATRDSDDILYYYIIIEHNKALAMNGTPYDIFVNGREFGLPSYETVGRTRRKLQEKYEDLRGSKWATRIRRKREEEFIAYALDK